MEVWLYRFGWSGCAGMEPLDMASGMACGMACHGIANRHDCAGMDRLQTGTAVPVWRGSAAWGRVGACHAAGEGGRARDGTPAVACRECRPWLIERVRSLADYWALQRERERR